MGVCFILGYVLIVSFLFIANYWHSFLGLSVAYLSGLQCSDSQQFGTYSQDDADVLRAVAEEPGIIDLFLTYPCFVINYLCVTLE